MSTTITDNTPNLTPYPTWVWSRTCEPPNSIPCHTLNADGVLCRYWGDTEPIGAVILSLIGNLITSGTPRTVALTKMFLRTLTSDERLSLFRSYCQCCGDPNQNCQCCNDE